MDHELHGRIFYSQNLNNWRHLKKGNQQRMIQSTTRSEKKKKQMKMAQKRDRVRICSQKAVKMATGVMGMCMVCYITGPPLCWHLFEALADVHHRSSCPPCVCDCSSFPVFALPQECMKPDDERGEEMKRSIADLLEEKLRMKEAESLESQRKAEVALLEARKLTSQYQKEADKCTSGMETCEEAKDKAEQALDLQRKLTLMWEARARQKGWMEQNDTS